MGVATGKLDGGPGAVEGVQGVCHRGHAVLAGHAADAELDRVGVVGLVLVGNLDGRGRRPPEAAPFLAPLQQSRVPLVVPTRRTTATTTMTATTAMMAMSAGPMGFSPSS